MASSIYFLPLLLLLLLLLLNCSHSICSPLTSLPTSKHPQTRLHLTRLFRTLVPVPVLVDLSSPFLSLPSSPSSSSSSSFLPRRSIPCSAALSSTSTSTSHPSHSDLLCTLSYKHPFSSSTLLAHLAHDVISFNTFVPAIHHFIYLSTPFRPFTCPVRGVLGLGRSRLGVAQQVTHSFGLSNKLSLCLSPSLVRDGVVLFGENSFFDEAANSMIYSPILTHHDDSYRIHLKSVSVGNKNLHVPQPSTVKFSTVSPYTLVKPEIYKQMIEAFSTEAENANMVRLNPVGHQFELCYENVKEIKKVPVIDLVLQSEMVRWRIYGPNSMVKVNSKGMCLGIMDGGEELEAEIVLGSHQLEDNLVEFDLGRSMIGFTSLAFKSTKCEHLSSLVLHNDLQSVSPRNQFGQYSAGA
ncbi:hypothetical protein vseg_008138 [Gypsophila vaccaria]